MSSPEFRLNRSALQRVVIGGCDQFTQKRLETWLAACGYQVVVAPYIGKIHEILRQPNPPKIIIVDWAAAEGSDFCRALREERYDFYPYVLIVSGSDERQDVAHALKSGADDYLVKPFDALDLAARLSVAGRILSHQDDLIRAREELRILASKDPLTGLFNRSAFLDLFQRELDRASRIRSHSGFLLLDLDHFKQINDMYGHIAGDEALKEVARRLKRAVRSYDFVGRYGGEEFCIVVSNCSETGVKARAEAIRLAIAGKPFLYRESRIRITTSIGAAVTFANTLSTEEIVAVADAALYRAKNAGRNCTVCCRKRLSEVTRSADSHEAHCIACEAQSRQECLVSAVRNEEGPPWSESLRPPLSWHSSHTTS